MIIGTIACAQQFNNTIIVYLYTYASYNVLQSRQLEAKENIQSTTSWN